VPDLLSLTPQGLHCPAGNFHVDPRLPVDRALITHGHADHARAGSRHYLTAADNVGILRARLGNGISVRGLKYGQSLDMDGVRVSFHPAGHVLGSSQIRVEHRGEVWVVSGDYKMEDDGISGAFEPVRCDTFITESTFGLPVYRWRPQREVIGEIDDWWRENQARGRASVLFTYSLGKAQRLLHAVDASIGPIFVHSAVAKILPAYELAGVRFPALRDGKEKPTREVAENALVIAPPAAEDSAWLRQFGSRSTSFASGWMRIRGGRRRGNFDRGFVISDHVDWPGMLRAIRETEARRVLVTHGYAAPTVRYLRETGYEAGELRGAFAGEAAEEE